MDACAMGSKRSVLRRWAVRMERMRKRNIASLKRRVPIYLYYTRCGIVWPLRPPSDRHTPPINTGLCKYACTSMLERGLSQIQRQQIHMVPGHFGATVYLFPLGVPGVYIR